MRKALGAKSVIRIFYYVSIVDQISLFCKQFQRKPYGAWVILI